MESNRKCLICGCEEIGKGRLTGYAVMVPIKGNVFNTGSETIADICTACGHILSMRVEKPEKFK
ncbi:transcription initiation factor TFIIIB (plasmid) [Clostridium estertheticum]|uniref:Transcription initiation factor TFIIIB n=1 Tax=Clostridium estertheticum TaxID=238834 RepID=A0AA47ENG5_9CLOT|nr:transcription initiation factor TFIIIB [Clostridium estertheticum]MBU3157717.1 transcription initiation factor TFIIIB [Clostridium estertheticum]MBU3201978.1 transcription initiation factor TFIIIB [Clostridium estertheticum]WAG63345.1 transcription initiation factor TFIIIB [Clostridium estertheticum]WAG68250.1 transcription initiation factor TFIIIB [Clostridium estertheticum]